MSETAPAPPPGLHDAAILIVDDEEANVRLLARILSRAGFSRVRTTTRSPEVLRLFKENASDLIVLDLRMPELDGFGVLAQLREVIAETDFLPILTITGDDSPDTRQRALLAGAKDFLGKPFEASEVVVRVRNLLTTRLLHRSLQQQNERLEQMVHARTAELEAALAAAQAASRAKSQFLATIGHELRTPLNAVIGFSNHLQKNKAGNLLPQDLTLLQRIGDNGAHLLELITDILDLTRIEAGKMPVELAPVALDQVVFETLQQLASGTGGGTGGSRAAMQRVEQRVTVPRQLRPLMTDESKLRRILINLVGNAAKFTEKGHLRVGVIADASGTALRLDVIDTGIGIPPERLGAIFDPFEQADNSTQRRFGGTGLGLAISRTLCELLGYRLSAVSDVGVGSAFSVLLAPQASAPGSYAELALSYERTAQVCA